MGLDMRANGLDELTRKAQTAQLLYTASERHEGDLFKAVQNSSNIGKAFYRDLRNTITSSDVVIEVVDARCPNGCRCEELERSIIASGKRLIILLNKIDLIPKSVAAGWLAYLRRRHPTLPFKSVLSSAGRVKQVETSVEKASSGVLKGSACVIGASALMGYLKNYARQGPGTSEKHKIKVGVIGYPNVGKSSVINSMLRSVNSVKVGGEAGVTRACQEVELDSHVWLIDSPGVVFKGDGEDADNVLRNTVKLSTVKDPKAIVASLIQRCPKEALTKYFKIPDFETMEDFLSIIARQHGRLSPGGVPDTIASARLVLHEWTTGKIWYYTAVPVEENEKYSSASIVSAMQKGLDLDALAESDATVLAVTADEEADGAMCMSDVGMDGEAFNRDENVKFDDEGYEHAQNQKQAIASAVVSNKEFSNKKKRRRAALVEGDVIATTARRLEAAKMLPGIPPLNRRGIEKQKRKKEKKQANRGGGGDVAMW
eukprot:GHVN01082300.1.p1 GENE.GHVN01082300.1~~GHVN01082300.1.p1  ORF type:complete len:486 (+),score=108.47 GHVN01082300.1:1992-3449(+)